MRYCEKCKRFCGTDMSTGQVAVATALLPTVIGFILYIIFHERKCSICHGPTCKVKYIKEESDYGKNKK